MEMRGKERESAVRTLGEIFQRVLVVAHRENVDQLSHALSREGFGVEVVRGPYSAAQQRFSLAIRCLVNHANAWRLVREAGNPVIIVEADFVPVRGFRELPAPFPGQSGCNKARFGWLYSPGSTLYGFDELGFPYGHGSTTVAYAMAAATAPALLEFFDREMAKDDPGGYRAWETYLGIFLRKEKGILNYIPIYQYGEHGGLPNREHSKAGIRAWHQADVMWGRLWFLPAYAKGSIGRLGIVRLRAWSRGVFRVVTWRYFDPRDVNRDSSRSRIYMFLFSVCRMLHLAHFVSGRCRRGLT